MSRALINWFIFCSLLSVIGFMGDFLLNPSHALQYISYLFLYLFLHLIGHFYLILPAILLYFFLFNGIEGRLLLKLLFFGMLILYIQAYLRPDDWNLTVGKYGNIKQEWSYLLAAVGTVLIDEFYIREKMMNSKKRWTKE